MTTPAAVQPMLDTFEMLPPATRAEWQSWPEVVRFFVPFEDASRAQIFTRRAVSDEDGERLAEYFERQREGA